MRAGTLNRQVRIERPATDQDEYGQAHGWVLLATVWANIRMVKGREFFASAADTSQATASVRIRYRTDITSAMRIVNGQVVYNIAAVLPDEEKREHVDLAVTIGMNDG